MSSASATPQRRLQGRLDDLQRLLGELLERHQELMEIIQRKLDAMRRCDAAAIQDCVQRKADLLERIQQREGLRRSLMVLIGREFGVAPDQARVLPVSRLTAHLAAERRERITAIAGQLTRVLRRIGEVNQVVALFARQMIDHHGKIVERLTRGGPPAAVYAARGARPPEPEAQVIDAVG